MACLERQFNNIRGFTWGSEAGNSGGIAFAAAAAVPEPATRALLAAGIAGIGFARRRAR